VLYKVTKEASIKPEDFTDIEQFERLGKARSREEYGSVGLQY